MIRNFYVISCDERPRVGSCNILRLVGMFGWGPEGLGCVSNWVRTISEVPWAVGLIYFSYALVELRDNGSTYVIVMGILSVGFIVHHIPEGAITFADKGI